MGLLNFTKIKDMDTVLKRLIKSSTIDKNDKKDDEKYIFINDTSRLMIDYYSNETLYVYPCDLFSSIMTNKSFRGYYSSMTFKKRIPEFEIEDDVFKYGEKNKKEKIKYFKYNIIISDDGKYVGTNAIDVQSIEMIKSVFLITTNDLLSPISRTIVIGTDYIHDFDDTIDDLYDYVLNGYEGNKNATISNEPMNGRLGRRYTLEIINDNNVKRTLNISIKLLYQLPFFDEVTYD